MPLPSNLVWQGDGSANVWTNAGPLNWLNGATPVSFNPGDNVTFDDSGSSSPSINLAASLAAGNISFVAAQDYTIGGSGALTGNGSLYKVGQGSLTLKTINTFTGGTTINEGSVQLGDGVSVNGSLSGNITNNDTLIFAEPDRRHQHRRHQRQRRTHQVRRRHRHAFRKSNLHQPHDHQLRRAGNFPARHRRATSPTTAFSHSRRPASTSLPASSAETGSATMNNSSGTIYLTGANSFAGGFTNTAGNTVFSNNTAAGTGPVIYTAGSVMVGGGCVITNDFSIPSSTADLSMQGTNGTGIWAGNVVNLGSGASWRPGADTGGSFTFTGNALMGARNFIVPRGSVTIASNAVVSATGTATAFGRDGTGRQPERERDHQGQCRHHARRLQPWRRFGRRQLHSHNPEQRRAELRSKQF